MKYIGFSCCFGSETKTIRNKRIVRSASVCLVNFNILYGLFRGFKTVSKRREDLCWCFEINRDLKNLSGISGFIIKHLPQTTVSNPEVFFLITLNFELAEMFELQVELSNVKVNGEYKKNSSATLNICA
jgi:hypothetical protein